MRKSAELIVAQNHAADLDVAEFDFGNLNLRGGNGALLYLGTSGLLRCQCC